MWFGWPLSKKKHTSRIAPGSTFIMWCSTEIFNRVDPVNRASGLARRLRKKTYTYPGLPPGSKLAVWSGHLDFQQTTNCRLLEFQTRGANLAPHSLSVVVRGRCVCYVIRRSSQGASAILRAKLFKRNRPYLVPRWGICCHTRNSYYSRGTRPNTVALWLHHITKSPPKWLRRSNTRFTERKHHERVFLHKFDSASRFSMKLCNTVRPIF